MDSVIQEIALAVRNGATATFSSAGDFFMFPIGLFYIKPLLGGEDRSCVCVCVCVSAVVSASPGRHHCYGHKGVLRPPGLTFPHCSSRPDDVITTGFSTDGASDISLLPRLSLKLLGWRFGRWPKLHFLLSLSLENHHHPAANASFCFFLFFFYSLPFRTQCLIPRPYI